VKKQGLTPRQRSAVKENPKLEKAFCGERVDACVRRAVDDDPVLSAKLQATPRGRFGPDFVDRQTGRWYDITTEKAWPAHMRKYLEDFGDDGVGIYYRFE
jgi:hypothetical protein